MPRPARNPKPIADYYAKGYSMRETGKHFGVSVECIRKILRQFYPNIIRAPYVGWGKSPRERLALAKGGK